VAANEIAERLAAAAWLRFGSEAGEGAAILDPEKISIRSAVGFQQRLIISSDLDNFPCVIIPLDRTLSRKETCVYGQMVSTVDDATRRNYPLVTGPATVYQPQPLVEPVHLDWIGDFADPDWLPLTYTPGAVPNGFDLDQYNAIAVGLVSAGEGGGTLAGDVTIFVLKHPMLEGAVTKVESLVYPAG